MMTNKVVWTWTCGTIKATELCDELIAIKIVAPTKPHIRAHITVGGVTPLNHVLCPQKKRMTQIHQLVTLTGVGYSAMPPGRAWRPCRPGTAATYGGSPSSDCTLQTACTSSNPQPTPWGKPSGSGYFNEDDQEVTFP